MWSNAQFVCIHNKLRHEDIWKQMEEENEADVGAGLLPVKSLQNTEDRRLRVS